MVEESNRRGPLRKGLIAVVAVLLLLIVFHAPLLNGLAAMLVREDKIVPADAIVVLTGDGKGERMMTGMELYKKGYGKKIVFWGGPIYWKFTWAELMLRQIEENDIPMEDVIWTDENLEQNSTLGEARVNMRQMSENGIRSFILVTSPYHTGRAGRVYEPLAEKKGMKMYVHPSMDTSVNLEYWWLDRTSAKMVYYELSKTIYYLLTN